MSAERRWSLVLADYAASLDRLEALLAGGVLDLDDRAFFFTPPADLPPMPGSMIAEATALLARSSALEAELTAARDATASSLSGLAAQPRSQPVAATGSSIDWRA